MHLCTHLSCRSHTQTPTHMSGSLLLHAQFMASLCANVACHSKVLQLYLRIRIGLSLATQLRLDSVLALLATNPANESVKLLAVAKSIQIRYTSTALGARCQNAAQRLVLQLTVCSLRPAVRCRMYTWSRRVVSHHVVRYSTTRCNFFRPVRFTFILRWRMLPVVGEVFSKSKSHRSRQVNGTSPRLGKNCWMETRHSRQIQI